MKKHEETICYPESRQIVEFILYYPLEFVIKDIHKMGNLEGWCRITKIKIIKER
jgi:hypothetical protein